MASQATTISPFPSQKLEKQSKSIEKQQPKPVNYGKAALGFNFNYPTRLQKPDKPAFVRVEPDISPLLNANPSMQRMKHLE